MMEAILPSPVAILRLDGYDSFYIPRWMFFAFILTLLASITVFRLTLLFIRWWNRPCKSPSRLFRALCDRHQLSHTERLILQNIAREETCDPNYLFIDPDLWQTKSSCSDTEKTRRELFRKLFGKLPMPSRIPEAQP